MLGKRPQVSISRMKYAIQINDSPTRSESPETALQFIKAALAAGHEVIQVFFYQDGIYNAFNSSGFGQDSFSGWEVLSGEAGIELVYCTSAAERRGLVNSRPGFKAGGLGLWVDACLRADRVMQFGA